MDLNNNPRATAEHRVKILRKRLNRVRVIDNTFRGVDWLLHSYEFNKATVAYNRARYRRIRSQIESELKQNERIVRAFN